MVECPICCADVVLSSCKTCCGFSACATCWKTWFTTNTNMTCMGCHTGLDRLDVSELLPTSFIRNTLKRHRQEQLMHDERQRCLNHTLLDADDARQRSKNQIQLCRDVQARLRQQIDSLQEHIQYHHSIFVDADNRFVYDNHHFIQHCTACTGQIVNGSCSVCHDPFCDSCGQVHQGECDPKAVGDYTIVKSSTKPCPACKVPIYKHDGCDDMWCIHCETPFNWKTLKIYNSIRHTPDVDTFQQAHNLVVELPGSIELARILDDNYSYLQTTVRWMELRTRAINLLRCIHALSQYHHSQQINFDRRLNEARLRYLREGDSVKDAFVRTLHRTDLDKEILRRLTEASDAFVSKVAEILVAFHDCVIHHMSSYELYDLFHETQQPISKFNTRMFKMSQCYQRIFPFVDVDNLMVLRKPSQLCSGGHK